MIIETSRIEKSPITSGQRRGIGLICLLIGLIIFLVAYACLHYKTGLFKLNTPILAWLLNHRTPARTGILVKVTTFVNPKTFAIIVALSALAWLIIKREFYRPILLVASVGVAAAAATIVKSIVRNTRPPHLDMILPLETGFSFPSMHTIVITVFILMFGYLIYSRKFSGAFCWIWNIASILVIALIAFSRLYLGYHWLTDVTAAFGLGLVVFGFMVLVDNILMNKLKLNGSEQLP